VCEGRGGEQQGDEIGQNSLCFHILDSSVGFYPG
jgi:hypothetical protein